MTMRTWIVAEAVEHDLTSADVQRHWECDIGAAASAINHCARRGLIVCVGRRDGRKAWRTTHAGRRWLALPRQDNGAVWVARPGRPPKDPSRRNGVGRIALEEALG